jgi:hypothetical protein
MELIEPDTPDSEDTQIAEGHKFALTGAGLAQSNGRHGDKQQFPLVGARSFCGTWKLVSWEATQPDGTIP